MSANSDHSAVVDRIASRWLQSLDRTSTRVPPNMQRAKQSIGRLWMGGDEAGARNMLEQHFSQRLVEYERDVTKGKSGSLPLSLARWFLDTAPSEMDTKDLRRRMPRTAVTKTAGEVRFIKDRGGDHHEWGWNPPASSERTIDPDYKFNAKNLEPLARTLRSILMALGHIQTARTTFTKIKSQRISPDGNLGGKGYVMPIKDIRKQLSNCDEALSSIADTLDDEIKAVHWHPAVDDSGGDPRARNQVKQIMDDVEEIKDDPEEWAEEEEDSMDGGSKLAAINRVASRYAESRRAS